MASILIKIASWIIILVIIVAVPTLIISTDYRNDQLNYANNRHIFEFDFDPNNASTLTQIYFTGEYPALTEIRYYFNFTTEGNSGIVRITFLEGSNEQKFRDDNLGLIKLPEVVYIGKTLTTWMNVTTSGAARTNLGLEAQNLNDTVHMEGYYMFKTQTYWERNLNYLAIGLGTYLILVFGVIPRAIRGYRLRKFRERMDQKRIKEEEEYYRRRSNQ